MLAVIEIWESELGKNDGNQRPTVWLVDNDEDAEKKIRDRMTELCDMFTGDSDMPDVVDQEYRPNDEYGYMELEFGDTYEWYVADYEGRQS